MKPGGLSRRMGETGISDCRKRQSFLYAAKQKEDFTMRDSSIDLVWAKIQMVITAVGGWLGYFVG